MSSRSLDDLTQQTRAKAQKMMLLAGFVGLDLLVTCTRRTRGEQADLYEQGRTKPGKIVTWAKPGESPHEDGRALDVVPLRGGVCVWGTVGEDLLLWQKVGEVGEAAGLAWGGRWPGKKRDFPHFQNQSKG